MAGTCRAAAAQRLAPWRGDDQPFARKGALSERAPTSGAEHAAQTSSDLADERWPRKVKDAAKTSSTPSVFRFPRKRTNATRRLARRPERPHKIFAAVSRRSHSSRMNWSPFLPERDGHRRIVHQTQERHQLVQHRATFTSCDGNPQWVDYAPLRQAVAREVSNDVCLDCLCRRDVGTAGGCVALLELGKSASTEPTRQLRIEAQPRTIIVDGSVPLTHLEVGQPARAKRPHIPTNLGSTVRLLV